jgi:glycerol kinase
MWGAVMPQRKYVLALDQGTTSSRTIVFNRQGKIVAKSSK